MQLLSPLLVFAVTAVRDVAVDVELTVEEACPEQASLVGSVLRLAPRQRPGGMCKARREMGPALLDVLLGPTCPCRVQVGRATQPDFVPPRGASFSTDSSVSTWHGKVRAPAAAAATPLLFANACVCASSPPVCLAVGLHLVHGPVQERDAPQWGADPERRAHAPPLRGPADRGRRGAAGADHRSGAGDCCSRNCCQCRCCGSLCWTCAGCGRQWGTRGRGGSECGRGCGRGPRCEWRQARRACQVDLPSHPTRRQSSV